MKSTLSMVLSGLVVTSALLGAPETAPRQKLDDATKLASEVADLETRLQNAEQAARAKTDGSSDQEIATRVILTETTRAKRRALESLRQREASQSSAETTLRRELQQKLAQAKTPEERQTILDRHIALQRAQSVDDTKAVKINQKTSK